MSYFKFDILRPETAERLQKEKGELVSQYNASYKAYTEACKRRQELLFNNTLTSFERHIEAKKIEKELDELREQTDRLEYLVKRATAFVNGKPFFEPGDVVTHNHYKWQVLERLTSRDYRCKPYDDECLQAFGEGAKTFRFAG